MTPAGETSSTRRWIRVLPWILCAAFVAALGGAIAAGMSEARPEPLALMDALWAVSFIGFSTTGAVIASRLPDRPLGWMFCAAPLAIMTGVALSEFAGWETTPTETGSWAAVAAEVLFDGGFAAFAVVPFFLPNGTLPPGRWGILGRVALVIGALSVALPAAAPAHPRDHPTGHNPLEIDALAPILEPVSTILETAVVLSLILGLTSVVARYRRATGIERLQSKWIAFGAFTMAGAIGVISLVDVFVDELPETVETPITIALIVALPVTIAIAMLRYRLYDIDVIINRTLVYAVLTAVLVGMYSGGVLLFRTLLHPLTGENDVAVAASTLAVAALFGPARRRIQMFIDHRFYRARYDAQQTLETFAARLRDEIDLDSLSVELLAVVSQTVQPRHASVSLIRMNR